MSGNNFLRLEDDYSEYLNNSLICYGHFTFLHFGHIRYFNSAKKFEKKTTILLTKGQNLDRTDQEINERVLLIKSSFPNCSILYIAEKEIIDLIPEIYNSKIFLGSEFREKKIDATKTIKSILKENNSEIIYQEGTLGLSATYLNQNASSIHHDRVEKFYNSCSKNNIKVDKLSKTFNSKKVPKVLIIGDTIVDEYVATEPLGLSAEAPVIVVREIESKKFIGGAGVVSRHINSLGADVSLLTLLGEDSEAQFVKEGLSAENIKYKIIYDPNRPTTFKKRYISRQTKLFRVSRLSQFSISNKQVLELKKWLDKNIQNFELIVFSDFQYGFLTPQVVSYITKLATKNGIKILADQQSSSQSGKLNKYKNIYAVFPTEKEARLTTDDWESSLEVIGKKIIGITDAKFCVLKLADEGLIVFEKDSNNRFTLPALSASPVDVAGAGDSLLSATAYGICKGLTFFESVVLGSVQSSIAVENIGNIPIAKDELMNKLKQVL